MNDNTKISDIYNSAEADITLISSDGMEFRVFSYILKTHSLMLQPILCDPAFKSSPITIDASCADLTLFLDMMYKKTPHSIANWNQAGKLLDLADQYECHWLKDPLDDALRDKAKREPWDAFCFASRRDDLAFSKKALKFMGGDQKRRFMNPQSLSFEDSSQVSFAYLLGLLPKLANYTPDWAKIADEIKPIYPKTK